MLFTVVIVIISVSICIAVFAFFDSAAPSALTISSGPENSIYHRHAEKYKTILAKEGVTLTIQTSEGSTDNLQKLANRRAKVDVAFVQSGKTDGVAVDQLMSLGSVS